MSLTIDTLPTGAVAATGVGFSPNNDASWGVSTSLSEDASHQNLRVRAELYHRGAIIAAKELPKGALNFSFNKILDSLVLPWKETPGGSSAAEGGGGGTDLISGDSWAQRYGNLNTFSQTVSRLTMVETGGQDEEVRVDMGAPTVGKVYVLVYENYDDTGANILNAHLVNSSWADDEQAARPIKTGSNQYSFVLLMPTTVDFRYPMLEVSGNTNVAADLFVYEMPESMQDFIAPYFVKFTEYYEDANGDTTVGGTISTAVHAYVKCTVPEGEVFLDDYVLATTDDKLASKWAGIQESLNLKYRSGDEMQLQFYVQEFGSFLVVGISKDGGSYAYTAIEALAGVGVVIINDLTAFTGSTEEVSVRIKDSYSAGWVSEEIIITKDSKCHDSAVLLEWTDELGGLSYFTFKGDYNQSLETKREYYQDANKMDQVFDIQSKRRRKLYAFFESEATLEYLEGLMKSNSVNIMTDAGRTPVTVKSTSLPTRNRSEIMETTIDIEYGS